MPLQSRIKQIFCTNSLYDITQLIQLLTININLQSVLIIQMNKFSDKKIIFFLISALLFS